MTTDVQTPKQEVRTQEIRQAALKAAEDAAGYAIGRLRDALVQHSGHSYGSVGFTTPEEQAAFASTMLQTFEEEILSRLGKF